MNTVSKVSRKLIPVAIFTRVSTRNQDYSRQINDLQKIADKEGYRVVATLMAKESGTKLSGERDSIQQLKKLAESGKIKKVLTTEISRLGRNPLENIKLLEELHAHHVSIKSMDMGIETLTPEGKPSIVGEILYTVFSSIYKQEASRLSERTISGLEQARLNGKTLGRPKGKVKSDEDMVNEYPGVVKLLKKGIRVVDICRLQNVDKKTVCKVRSCLYVLAA